MRTKTILVIVLLFFGLGLVSNVWASELVKDYYDPVNDWFVFEWDRPDYGNTTTIYDPPNKVKPIIKAQIDFNRTTKEYIYNYEVTNQTGAKQNLIDIIVKYLAPIYDAKSPVPVEDWYMARFLGKDVWRWAKTGGEPSGILPDKTEKGLSFKSKGLPTIVNSVFFGDKRAIYSPPGDYDTDEIEDSFERVMKSLEEQYKDKFEYIVKRTLGPTAPPADFKPVAFVDYIISQKHEAYSLGWIKNKGIENSLDEKLDNAKKKIETGDTKTAQNILNAFINEVEAQGCKTYDDCPSGKHLTPEAYALLKYNMQYLIDNLK
jgi:hypothetical protein